MCVGSCVVQTLSGRDLEYHISANNSMRQFKDLRHEEVITSWLGLNLTVTHGNNEVRKIFTLTLTEPLIHIQKYKKLTSICYYCVCCIM